MLGMSNGGRWEPELLHIEGSLAANAIRAQAQVRGVSGDVGGDLSGDLSGGMGRGMGGGVAKSSGGSSSSNKRRKADRLSLVKTEAMAAEGPCDVVEEDAAVEQAEAAAEAESAAEDEAAAAEAEVAARRARNTWLGCDLCGKWRRLGRMKEGELPEQWTCAENPDGAYAS